MTDVVAVSLAQACASETARIISTLIRATGDWSLAEDCLQDACAKALVDWPVRGIPDNPGAWLTTVAKNRAIDRLRQSTTEAKAMSALAHEPTPEIVTRDALDSDDRLRLIYTCCHPALPMDARVALTLKTVGGLSIDQIARVFLVSEDAMAKRLVRTRAKIKNAGIPYRVPAAHLLPERTRGVMAVLYLMFTEGYSATGGDALVREPLVTEAIRLTKLVIELLDSSPFLAEAEGLLALMLFQHARTSARTDSAGELVTLENQDRSLWNTDAAAEGFALLQAAERTRGGERRNVYELQAQIAACHLRASTAADTDFARIAALYEELSRLAPSPIVELNRAVAVAMSQGPDAGLAILDRLASEPLLADYYLLPATRADLLRRLGRRSEAAVEYARARDLAPSDAERRYLERRVAETEPKSR